MARRTQRSANKNGFGEFQFVNVNLNKSDKPEVDNWLLENEADLPIYMDEIVASGHKLSLSWSDYSDCYTCSASGVDESSANYHKILTARAGSAFDALVLLLFKHHVRCSPGIWPEPSAETEQYG